MKTLHQTIAAKVRVIAAVTMLVTVLGSLNSAALATTAATVPVRLEGGKADFGSGLHVLGSPSGTGMITWDYTPNSGGLLIASARVAGTLYLDDTASGRVRLIIEYRARNTDGSVGALLTNPHNFDLQAGAAFWGALDSTHQKPIDDSFSSSALHFVVLKTRVVNANGSLSGGTSGTSGSPNAGFELKVEGLGLVGTSGRVDFRGAIWQEHEYASENNAVVDFTRVNGQMTGSVGGTLYWISQTTAGTSRLNIDFLDINGNLLASRSAQVFGTGGDPNLSRNKVQVNESFSSGRLWKIRLTVGSVIGTRFSSQANDLVSFND